MAEYLIRTDKEQQRTHIIHLGSKPIEIARIYTDFLLYKGIKDISSEEIINPDTQKVIGNIKIRQKKDLISTFQKNSKLSSFNLENKFIIDKNEVPFTKLSKIQLSQRDGYASLEENGIESGYFFNDKSDFSRILYYEKDGDISGVVSTKRTDDILPLIALPLVLSQRILVQDYLFSLLK